MSSESRDGTEITQKIPIIYGVLTSVCVDTPKTTLYERWLLPDVFG